MVSLLKGCVAEEVFQHCLRFPYFMIEHFRVLKFSIFQFQNQSYMPVFLLKQCYIGATCVVIYVLTFRHT